MASGKYAAISGAVARMRMMDTISEHLAAAKTPGYKKEMQTFEARLGEANSGLATRATNYSRISGPTIDFTPGHIEHSGDPLDLAINGDGFFQIERPDGSFGYARKGNFQLDGDGRLVDTNGLPVLDSNGGDIILPHSDVDISPDGRIWAGEQEIARIGLYRFADTSILRRAGGDMFQPVDETQPEPHPEPQLVQKSLEASNIDMMRSMTRMTSNLRAFEATQKALRIYSEMGTKAIELGQVQ